MRYCWSFRSDMVVFNRSFCW